MQTQNNVCLTGYQQALTPLCDLWFLMQGASIQVLSHGSFAGQHPVNRKAKCTVYLRDLQQQAGLTDEALQLIARVCGPRSVHTYVRVTVCLVDSRCCLLVYALDTTGCLCHSYSLAF